MTTRLRIRDIPFTLFYDYDQLQTGNLAQLNALEKVLWFEARHEHTFLRPQRAFWVDEQLHGRLLKLALPPFERILSSKLMIFGGLMNACEALGAFLIPGDNNLGKNRRRFEVFMNRYMGVWNVAANLPGEGPRQLVEVLWNRYRNSIAHGFQIKRGGIEYLPAGTRWSTAGNWLRVCPRQFVEDYEAGAKQLIHDVRAGGQPLVDFTTRFQDVYPC